MLENSDIGLGSCSWTAVGFTGGARVSWCLASHSANVSLEEKFRTSTLTPRHSELQNGVSLEGAFIQDTAELL